MDIPGTFPRLKILILLTSVNSYMKFIYPLPVTYHALMLLSIVISIKISKVRSMPESQELLKNF